MKKEEKFIKKQGLIKEFFTNLFMKMDKKLEEKSKETTCAACSQEDKEDK